jgi:hypothetical protein
VENLYLSLNPPTKEMYGIISSIAVERMFKIVNKYKNTQLQNKIFKKEINPTLFFQQVTVNSHIFSLSFFFFGLRQFYLPYVFYSLFCPTQLAQVQDNLSFKVTLSQRQLT